MTEKLKRIKTLKQENQWSTIIAEFSPDLEKQFRNDHAILAEVAFACTQLNNHNRAIELYARCVELRPRQAYYLYSLGYAYYNKALDLKTNDDHRTAVELFKQALDIQPDFPACSYRLGKIYNILEKPRKAIPHLTDAIEFFENISDPDRKKRFRKIYAKSLFQRGKAHQRIRAHDKAIDDFTQAWVFDTYEYIDPVYYPYNIGVCYRRKKDYKAAIEFLNKALQINRYKEYIHDQLGRAFTYAGDYQKAADAFEKAIKIKPRTYIFVNRGILRYLAGDLQGARKDFSNALKRDKLGKHKIYLHLGQIAVNENDFAKAEELFRKAIDWRMQKYGTDYFKAHVELAKLYQMMGKPEEAEKEWKIVEEIDPYYDFHDKEKKITIGEVA